MTVSDYCRILYELQISPDITEQAEEIICRAPQVSRVLESPVVKIKEKWELVEKIFPRELQNFLKVLCKYHKVSKAQEIFRTYQEYYNEKNNILNATLTYVVPPDDRQLDGIKKILCRTYGASDVDFHFVRDEDLIGGFTIRIKDREIDYSLRGRIHALQQKLTWR